MASALLASCSPDQEKEIKSAKLVKITTIQSIQSPKAISFNAQVLEKDAVNLSFRVGGPLAKLSVSEGDYVQKGQVIATIDKRDYEIAVRQAKAQFEQVEAEFERMKTLYEKGKLPANNYDKVKSGFEMASSAYEHAQNQLKDTQLKTPFSGYITHTMANNFETVGPGQPIVGIIDISSFEVVVKATTKQLDIVKQNEKALLSLKDKNIYDKEVKLKSISQKAGRDNLYEVRYTFLNDAKENIRAGMSADISLYNEASDVSSAIIPISALFTKNGKNYVWVMKAKDGKLQKKEVKLGKLLSDGNVEVKAGLNTQDQVVAAGVNYLFEGQEVKAIKEASSTNIGGLL